jgi:hypothetical protein
MNKKNNSLPVPIKDLFHNTKQFKSALNFFLCFHSFYVLDEYSYTMLFI